MQIRTVGIVGLGLMGRSIASNALWKNFNVIAYTHPAGGFADARTSIAADVEEIIAHGAAPPELLDEWQSRYAEAKSLADFAKCELVIESVTEDVDIKRRVIPEIESAVGETVIIATN